MFKIFLSANSYFDERVWKIFDAIQENKRLRTFP